MSVELVLELAWKSAALAGLTLIVLRLAAGRSAAERSRVAHAGLLALLLLPPAMLLLPALAVETPAPLADLVASAPGAEAAAPAATPLAEAPPVSAEALLAALLLIPAAVLLGMTLVAVLRLQRLRARSEVMRDSAWLGALAAMQHRFGFKHGTALLVSSELASPISWGVMRPVILLDPRAAAATGDAAAVIAHELAHVARLDWAKLIAGRAATAIFWFNPLVWLLAARCHELREEAADDAVLRTDVDRSDYAELLVQVARHENRGLLLAANGVAPSRGSLKRRVMRILDPAHSRVPARLGWTAACLAAAGAVGASLAALEPGASAAATPPAAVGQGAPLLADPSPEVRGSVARALGESGATEHSLSIAGLLRDPDKGVRRHAAHALGDLQDPRTRPALEAALKDPDPAVRSKAAWALRQVAEAEAVLRRFGRD